MFKAWRIIKKFKPDVVVGVGGFASGPTLRMGIFSGVPALIQEQNSYPGVTNKILAKKVNKICVAYDGMEKYFPKEKMILTGNPVRQDIQTIENKRTRALEFFDLSPNKKTLLVIGGSLGARSINLSVAENIKVINDSSIQLIWQTGKPFYSTALKVIEDCEGNDIKVFDFINKMDYGYAAADAVISRAGAGAVSELCLVSKPVILVPYPYAAEDHQTMNAMALVNHNAAIHVKDSEATSVLIDKALKLINDTEACERLSSNIKKLAVRDSADIIAEEVLNLARNKK